MIKNKYLFIFSVFFFLSGSYIGFGQNKLEVQTVCEDVMYGDYHREIPVKNITVFNQFPTKIQYIVNSLLNQSMTDFKDSMCFVRGLIVNYESKLSQDSTVQVSTPYQLPKYEMYFEMSAPSLHIKTYCVGIELDQYGQIIYFGWPRENHNKKEDFAKLADAYAIALRLAKGKKYKTEKWRIDLIHSRPDDGLNWQISFLQKMTGDENQYTKEYKTFVVDAISLDLINEYDMGEVKEPADFFLVPKP